LFFIKRFALVFTDEPINVSSKDLPEEIKDALILPVPSRFASHFSHYSQQKGFLAEQMRRQTNLPAINPSSSLYRDYLSKKTEVATSCAEYLLRNGFEDGLFRFGFYFKNYLSRLS